MEPARPTSFDAAQLADRCMGDAGFALEMLTIFQNQVPPMLAKLTDSLAVGRVTDAAAAAHALKGTAGNLAAVEMYRTVTELERVLRAGDLAAGRSALPAAMDAASRALQDVPRVRVQFAGAQAA